MLILIDSGDLCMKICDFTDTIWNHYHKHRRSFPWRDEISPYRVVISEVMLQQTQTHRVVPKFESFIKRFPDFKSLATASFSDVLSMWKGLGYNRRALNLQKTAHLIHHQFADQLSDDPKVLLQYPGIGKATAASIVTFAYNQPEIFIETNIRTVFIHCFFSKSSTVDDKEILPLIEKTIDHKDPRNWYYALMDYGVMLKKTVGNKSQQSKHYARQSRFKGSDRQIRGQILQALLQHKTLKSSQIASLLNHDSDRTSRIVDDLCHEGMLIKSRGVVRLKDI